MDIIVDIQGFRKPHNEFVLKELGVTTVLREPGQGFEESQEVESFLFSPPCNWNELPTKYRSMNLWLTRNFHGLTWEVGNIPYSKIGEILKKVLHNKHYVYVKGLEKKRWLEQMMIDTPVINLEDFKCPSLQKLRAPMDCLNHHEYTSRRKFHCALENVQALKIWYLEYSELDVPSAQRSLDLYKILGKVSQMAPQDLLHLPIETIMSLDLNDLKCVWCALPN